MYDFVATPGNRPDWFCLKSVLFSSLSHFNVTVAEREGLNLDAAATPRTPIRKSQVVEGSGAVAISPKSLQSWLLP